MPGDDNNSARSDERCGLCGASVTSSGDLCPVCGALLSAYRTADMATMPPSPEPAPAKIVAPRPAPRNEPEPAVQPLAPGPSEELRAARQALLAMLVAPERRLIDTVRPPEPRLGQTSSPPAVKTGVAAPPIPHHRPAGQPAVVTDLPRLRTTRPVSTPVRAQGKGFVSTSPVEPVLLIGVLLLVTACLLVACASLASVRSVAIFGFFFGIVGILAIAIAVLAVLVQRDRRRE